MLGSFLVITFAAINICSLNFAESWHKPWRLPTKMAASRSILGLCFAKNHRDFQDYDAVDPE